MAGVVGRVDMMKGLRQHVLTAEKLLRLEAEDAAVEAGIVGEQTVRNVIATTPSSLSKYPKNNRIWTGQMINAVTAKVTKRGTTINIKVGWLEKKEGYFRIQDQGGTVQGKTVTPMNALAGAQTAMRESVKARGFK